MTNVSLTLFLSSIALIWSCLVFRSVTIGNWGWTRALLMMVLFAAGMVGVVFVVQQV